MSDVEDEIREAVNAFLTLGEVLAFDGVLDTSTDENARAMRVANAEQAVTEIAARKGITVEQLCEKVKGILARL